MQGLKRRITYVAAFEVCGLTMSTLWLSWLSGSAASSTGPLAVMITTLAMTWNFFYNIAFEAWERRQVSRARTVLRRVAHAIGFQLTLVLYLIPLIAWWMRISLWQAFLLDFALMLIIPLYSFLFTWAFDRVFGEPDSAKQVNRVRA
ncbi:PACE efflux transporter [Janthinobacterium agaricidamnosum]|uniref:Bacterial Transmembrane Pair family protein n=1 Tax=Janthinobacterium agaricidamnosum NBRC 102515 = DSM 9628 TaxID=1349767 RepID=W0V5K2_9BURK|nr:PACE efflux transporter [Janthinobacterium agaricidamnosum]CDG82532.1 bacterial Transmembrane Pair family protein [Janthinobacterium agaricidamnosum NBRC 102515 = DSM 9628]